MPDKPIHVQAFTAARIRKFVEMGMLEERKTGNRTAYFLTNQGRIILANFGIEEKGLYEKPK